MTKVLIVDDHDLVRRGLKQLLSDEMGTVEFGEASHAQGALDQLAIGKWDIVLLDVTMPGRSGIEVLMELKQRNVRVPVLMLSAFPEKEFALRALRHGAAGYITKQAMPEELVAAIQKILAGGRYVSPELAEVLAFQLSHPGEGPAHQSLSDREFQVLRLVAKGKTIKEVATELSLSEKTVGTYRLRISEKLGLGTNVELARYALQNRLVD